MNNYEMLISEAAQEGISVREKTFKSKAKGLIKGNKIGISSAITSIAEKACVLAEEIGHHRTTVGNILNQSQIINRRQERRAREWAYDRLIPLKLIIEAHRARVTERHNIADFLGVTDEFLQLTIDRYTDKYGLFTAIDGHIIVFEPLTVIEPFEF